MFIIFRLKLEMMLPVLAFSCDLTYFLISSSKILVYSCSLVVFNISISSKLFVYFCCLAVLLPISFL
jgi:hypothetical protein